MRLVRYIPDGLAGDGLEWLPAGRSVIVTQPSTDPGSAAAGRPPDPWLAAFPRVSFTSCDLALAGQRLNVAPGRYDWVYLILTWRVDGPGCLDIDDVLWLEFRGGLDPEYLRTVPAAIAPAPGAVVARAGGSRRDDLLAVTLPVQPRLRLLAMGLARGDVHQEMEVS